MEPHRFYLSYGGGLGDVVFDYLRDPASRRVASLVEDYGAQVRVYTQCHNDGVLDLFHIHPHISEHIAEPWRMPNESDVNRFKEPLDGYIPIHRVDLLINAIGMLHRLETPQIHLTRGDQIQLAGLLSVRPCICLQPYAGLSDRDGFDPESLAALVREISHLNSQARIILLGKNHERGHKYTTEVGVEHPQVLNMIDQMGIRLAYHLVAGCDAFGGCHSNLIRTAWDFRRRNLCVLPDPLMTRHMPQIDQKYLYGFQYPETRTFTYPFDLGQPREFMKMDFVGMAQHLLGR